MIWTLLIIYQFKHFVADYLLQGRYMLGKFKKYPDYILPLAAHAAVHTTFTTSIALFVCPKYAVLLGLLDGTIHFVVDRIKASPDLLGRFKALSASEMMICLRAYAFRGKKKTKNHFVEGSQSWREWEDSQDWETAEKRMKSNTYFWWSLGLDQTAHHLTDLLLIYLTMRYG